MVGEEEVTFCSPDNDLPESKGAIAPLKPKGNFGPRPHLIEEGRGHVYFIRAGRYIKIGFSTRPLERLKALQTSHPDTLEFLAVRAASRYFEAELHEYFKDLRVRGEWFRAEEPLLAFIDENTPEGVAAAKALRSPALSAEAKDMIKRLINTRAAHGAHTIIGHACSNLAEQIEAMAGYVRPDWATHECQTLPYMMNRQMKTIEAARAAAN